MKITVKRKDLCCRCKQRTVYVLQALTDNPKEWVDFGWGRKLSYVKDAYSSDETMFRDNISAQRIVKRVDFVVDIHRLNLEESNADLPF